MQILLIRHFKTKGNLEKRYVGRTDEPIWKESIRPHIFDEKLNLPTKQGGGICGIKTNIFEKENISKENTETSNSATEPEMPYPASEAKKSYPAAEPEMPYSASESEMSYPSVEAIYSSPLKRCLQTAKIIYGEREVHTVNSLIEMDFGDFEGKNYEELAGNSDYQSFIDSEGTGQIPNGENLIVFKKRCCDGFIAITEEAFRKGVKSIAIVCHGGTIMAIMQQFSLDKKSFYSFMVENGCGYKLEYDNQPGVFTKVEKLSKGWNIVI